MFDEDDPIYQEVSEIALGFPGADMKVSHGRPAFFTKKIFATYGGSIKIDGEYVQHPESVLIVPDPDDKPALENDDRFYIPAYWGPWGWMGFDLEDGFDHEELTELIDASYRLTATNKLIKELDAR